VDITVALAFDEKAALRLLNWLAKENEREIRIYDRRAAKKGEASLPTLYGSGVRYEVEKVELWSDYINLMIQGFEDCDALAAARAGELMARGWRVMRPRDPNDPVRYPGDGGFATAMRLKPRSIRAEVMLTTDGRPGRPGLYHCIVRYWIGGREYRDDPSARLGMLTGDSAEERAGIAGKAPGFGGEDAAYYRTQGRRAQTRGAPYSNNPHKPSGWQHHAWNDGWVEGYHHTERASGFVVRDGRRVRVGGKTKDNVRRDLKGRVGPARQLHADPGSIWYEGDVQRRGRSDGSVTAKVPVRFKVKGTTYKRIARSDSNYGGEWVRVNNVEYRLTDGGHPAPFDSRGRAYTPRIDGFGGTGSVSRCVSGKMRREGWAQDRAVAACLNMSRAGRLGPRGGYRRVRR